MSKQLFIRLPAMGGVADAQVSWVLRDQQRAGRVYRGDLQDAAQQAAGARVTVLAPSSEVLLAQVALPPLKGQRLAKAAPYALEEQLADDVENLHVALGGRDEAGQVANAVVATTTLEHWLAQLREAGLHPEVVSPEIFGLAWSQEESADEAAGGWSLLVEDGRVLLRSGVQQGMAFELENLLPVLTSALEGLAEKVPQQLSLRYAEDTDFVESVHYREVAQLCSEQGIALDVQPLRVETSALLAQGFDESRAINLLQGDYSIRGQLQKTFRPWLPALLFLLAWVLLQAGQLSVEYVQLDREQDRLSAEISRVYQESFPDSRLVPGQERVLMERGLAQLRGAGQGESSMLDILLRAGPLLSGRSDLSLRSLRYREHSLDVDLQLTNLQDVDTLKQRLEQEAGLRVKVVSASARDDKVEARLSLKASEIKGAGGGR